MRKTASCFAFPATYGMSGRCTSCNAETGRPNVRILLKWASSYEGKSLFEHPYVDVIQGEEGAFHAFLEEYADGAL